MALINGVSKNILFYPLKYKFGYTCFTRLLNYVSRQYDGTRNPAGVFFNSEVQSLLKSLTRVDLRKVYKKKKLGDQSLEIPTYKFLTEEQLQDMLNEATERADEILQMPPVVQVRLPINKVLLKDPSLQGLETSKHIVTDITYGLQDSQRLIVVREPDGKLIEADWNLRDRLNQLYFPKIGRKLQVPRVFQNEFLSDVLSRKEYEFVLDRACVQFEPDDPEYQRITSVSYQYINDNGDFDTLRSTRHFGPLVFFLTWFENVDNFLLELIETSHIKDAVSLIHLYKKIHRLNLEVETEVETSDLELIRQFIALKAQKKGPLELALQAYTDMEKQQVVAE